MSSHMSNVFLIGDLHFGHKNIHKFRTCFKDEEEHQETIIELWNNVVGKRDIVWVLGDACFKADKLPLFNRMKGQKNLILGNHDVDAKDFFPYFNKVGGFASYKHTWLSHAPIHPDELRGRPNIHGHTHNHKIADKRYLCVSCEQVGYTPIYFEACKEFLNA